MKKNNFLLILFIYLSSLSNSFAMQADVFVQSTVNRASKLLSENITKEEKMKLINIAWKIARADNEVDKYEEHRIRKISELLYLNHADFIKEKIDSN